MSKQVLYVSEAVSTNDNAPEYGYIVMDDSLIERIESLRDLAIKHELSELRCCSEMVFQQVDGGPVNLEELVVTPTMLWFAANMKHADDDVKTIGEGIDTFINRYRLASHGSAVINAVALNAVWVDESFIETEGVLPGFRYWWSDFENTGGDKAVRVARILEDRNTAFGTDDFGGEVTVPVAELSLIMPEKEEAA